jgi:transcription antitermination factor NusG
VANAWYAVYTKFQHDKSAAALLERKDFEVFFPVYRAVHRWKDRNQIVVLPLFPCYLFLRTELVRKTDILRTAGVRWIVENAGHACVVPDSEIESVQKICAAATRVQPHPFLRQGDLVRICRGPLLGMEGYFVRSKNQYRVVVSIDLLQKSVAVEVDLGDVELMNAGWKCVRVAAMSSQKSA